MNTLAVAFVIGFACGAMAPWLYHLRYRRRVAWLLQRLADTTGASLEMLERLQSHDEGEEYRWPN